MLQFLPHQMVLHIIERLLEIYIADIEYRFVCFSFFDGCIQYKHTINCLPMFPKAIIVPQVECYLLPIQLVCHKELLRRPSQYSSIV